MTQKVMAELFDTGIDNINVHLKNIFDSNELDRTSTIEENSIVQKEEKNRSTNEYYIEKMTICEINSHIVILD